MPCLVSQFLNWNRNQKMPSTTWEFELNVKVHCFLVLHFDYLIFLTAKVSKNCINQKKWGEVPCCPSAFLFLEPERFACLWWNILISPSSFSYYWVILSLAVLGCLFFSVCFCIRRNTLGLLDPSLDFSVWLSDCSWEANIIWIKLRTNKYKGQDEYYQKCIHQQGILAWSQFTLRIFFSSPPVTSFDHRLRCYPVMGLQGLQKKTWCLLGYYVHTKPNK